MDYILQRHFPELSTRNASHRYNYELVGEIKLRQEDGVLLYIMRNHKNEDYFKFNIDHYKLDNGDRINIMFFYRDEIFFYRIDNTPERMDAVVRKLRDEINESA